MTFQKNMANDVVKAARSQAIADGSKNEDLPERRYKRGYDTSHLPEHVRAELKKAEESNLVASVAEAALTLVSIPLVAIAAVYAMGLVGASLPNAAAAAAGVALVYVLAATGIARQMRGLELMVHDASHLAWTRSKRRLNNLLANVLVAVPVLSTVEAYWKSHRIHHGSFGSHLDPCRQRFADMGLEHLDLSTRWKIVKAVVAWLPEYNAAYYREIGSQSGRQWAYFAAWHISFLIAPGALLIAFFGSASAVDAIALAALAWVGFWMLPATTVLPVIRSIAESEEHDYAAGETEFDTTYTNDGWVHRVLIHPKNDAYHLVHHMFPNIPERRHRRVHKLLTKYDKLYQESLQRERVLDRA
ncbi:fatty acid desaturase [Celeribacter neptunius]|uniref:Fatty acid desaturase n=1 Tax=Celeribacter neptunius TaxID=588602 RepID=A0A1I3Y0E3_9RHOB|nr:fatty acid desaturase [Celeribacter neptunius]SFK24771.1 Fatty acid desaturase [Celeribacter neptunius]